MSLPVFDGGGPLNFGFMAGVPPLWSFARASNAWDWQKGVLVPAATGQPRFESDVSGNALGLLCEPQASNLWFPSQTFAGFSVSPAGCLVATDNVAISPDGTQDASKLATNDTANNGHQMYNTFAGANTTTYTGSICAKSADYSRLNLNFNNTGFGGTYGALFDLAAGTVVNTTANATSAIKALGNGWYQCSVTVTSGSGGSPWVFAFGPAPASVATMGALYTPAATGLGVYVFGANVKAIGFLDSLIETTTGTLSRAPDRLTLNLAQLPSFNGAAGFSFGIECDVLSNGQSSVVPIGVSGAAGFSTAVYVTLNAGSVWVTNTNAPSSNSASISAPAAGSKLKIAVSVLPSGLTTLGVNGATVTTTSGPTTPATSLAAMSAPWAASNYVAGHAKKVPLWPGIALTAAQLAQVTT
jgi:hypothetical protein